MASKKSSKKSLTSSIKKIITRKKPVKKAAKPVKKAARKPAKKTARKAAPKRKAVKMAAPKRKATKKTAKKGPAKKAKPKKTSKAKPKPKAAPKPKVPKYTFRKLKNNNDHYQFLIDQVGDEGMAVVKKIVEKEVSDVDLAESLSHMKPNIVRKHLYALYEAGVVTYRRHRSKTGWYTYFWKLHPDRIDAAIYGVKQNTLKELHDILEYERENDFYECKKGCTRVIFDEAVDMKFRCPGCENQLEFKDNSRRISQLQKQAGKLSK